MSDEEAAPPPTVPADEAYRRLGAAKFTQHLANASERPRTQMWLNQHGKVVYVDFVDDTFRHCWQESLEIALGSAEIVPAHPWSPWWAALLGIAYKPDRV
jgi:hypothetical protein